jgi:hypothetical protein
LCAKLAEVFSGPFGPSSLLGPKGQDQNENPGGPLALRKLVHTNVVACELRCPSRFPPSFAHTTLMGLREVT